MRAHWQRAYTAVKDAVRLHNWHLPHATLARAILELELVMVAFSRMGVTRESQMGWFNAGLWMRAPPDVADAVFAMLDEEYGRRERAREQWAATLADNQTLVQLLFFVQRYLDRQTWRHVLPILADAWLRLDPDEGIVAMLLWMEIKSALIEEVRYFRQPAVGLILRAKLAQAPDAPLVVGVARDWPASWESLARAMLDYYWLRNEPTTRHFLLTGPRYHGHDEVQPEDMERVRALLPEWDAAPTAQ
jgi:hypothetical protein